jgi:hypothetical protein
MASRGLYAKRYLRLYANPYLHVTMSHSHALSPCEHLCYLHLSFSN